MTGIDESCSFHISRLSQWHPLFPAAQGDILAAFLDALSSVHVLSPHAHPLSSTFKIDPGCGGFSPPPLLLFLPASPGLSQPPPLFPPRNILVLQQTCWRTQVGAWQSRTGEGPVPHPPPPGEGPGPPRRIPGSRGPLHLPGTRPARARLGLCLTSPDTLLVNFLASFRPPLRNHF